MAAIWSPCDPPIERDILAEREDEQIEIDVQSRIARARDIELADIVLDDEATIPVDDPRAFTDALLRPTDDMDVALAMSGTDILTEFGADPQVEAAIAAILDGLADCSLTAATIAHVDLTQRLSVLVGQRRRVVRSEPPSKDPDGMARPITGAPLIDGIQDQVALLSRLRGVVRGALDRLEV